MRDRINLPRHMRAFAVAIAALTFTPALAQPVIPGSATTPIGSAVRPELAIRMMMSRDAAGGASTSPAGAIPVNGGASTGAPTMPRSLALVDREAAAPMMSEAPMYPPAAAGSEKWRVTLVSGESYSDVSLIDMRGDELVLGREGDTAMVQVERIAELRLVRSWSTWRSIGYGAMAGGVVGYVAGAASKSDEPASTFLAAGMAGGALIGWLVGQALSPADDVYDLTRMSRLERTETIGRLLTR